MIEAKNTDRFSHFLSIAFYFIVSYRHSAFPVYPMVKRALTYDYSVNSQPEIKRSEPTTPSMISTTDSQATVKAVLMSLSLQKTDSAYFHKELTDGTGVIRFVGVDHISNI